MAQFNRHSAFVAVLGVSLMLLSGCSASRKTEIKDAWLTNVPWEKQGSLRQYREARERALAQLAKANAGLQDAEPQLDKARRQAAAAKLRGEAFQKLLEADRLTRPQLVIHEAGERVQAGKATHGVAEAELRWSKENLSDWMARKHRWKCEVQLAQAQLNYAGYQILKAQGDRRVEGLTDEDFQSELSDAKDKATEARGDAEAKTGKAQRAREQWQQLLKEARDRGYFGNESALR